MADQDSTWLPLYGRDGTVRGHVQVDVTAAVWLNQWVWRLDGNGYASRGRRFGHKGPYRRVFLHRVLLGLEYGDPRQGDHINRDRLDCRMSNLRIVTAGENSQNVSGLHGSTSRHRGVFWMPRNRKWAAKVGRKYLGLFEREDDAAAAARQYRVEHMTHAHD